MPADSRSIYDRLRRTDLYKVGKFNNVAFPPNASAKQMRTILQGYDIDPKKAIEFEKVVTKDENGNTVIEEYPTRKQHYTANKQIDYASEIEKHDSVEDIDAAIALLMEKKKKLSGPKTVETMDMGDLRAFAKELGVKFQSTTNKQELINLIRNVS